MYKLLLSFILCFFVLFSGLLKAQSIKIGIVDTEVITKEMPEAVEAEKKIKKLSEQYRDSLMKIQQEYTTRVQQLEQRKGVTPPEQQKAEEEALKALEMQYMQLKEEKFGNQGELVQMTEDAFEPIRAKVRKSIETVAKEEKMNFVLEKKNAALLYAEDKFDITYKVLDVLKRGENK